MPDPKNDQTWLDRPADSPGIDSPGGRSQARGRGYGRNDETNREVIGSLTGYLITAGVLLGVGYILGLISQDAFVYTGLGLAAGVGVTRWLWSKAEIAWRYQRRQMEQIIESQEAQLNSRFQRDEDKPVLH